MGLFKSLFKSKLQNTNNENIPPLHTESAPSAPVEQSNELPTLHVPSEIQGCTIAYKYEEIDVAGVQYNVSNLNSIKVCDKLEIQAEPDNGFDPKAIKLTRNGLKIGYLHKGKLQDMAQDWIKRGDPIFAAITSINAEVEKVQIFIAFYRDPLYGLDKYEKITTSLTKTSKKDMCDTSRQENLEFLSVNTILQLDYNSYDEDYIVYDDYGNELGELSKSISKKLQDGEPVYEYIAVVDETTISDSDKYGAKISIYLKPIQ